MNKTNRWIPQGIRHRVAIKSRGKCYHCGKKAIKAEISPRGYLRFFDENGNAYHTDHLKERRNGGMNHEDNLVLSCETCNVGRRNKKAQNDPVVLEILKEINKK